MATDTTDVVIGVLAYRRPLDLEALIPLLSSEIDQAPDGYTVRLVIVDNDPDGGAQRAVTAAAEEHPSARISYSHEATPGIAGARNRAISAAGTADILIFIDDDERPSPGWLRALLHTHRRFGASIAGPVSSVFEVEPDAWVTAGRYFERRRPDTGTLLDVAATNNLLLDMATVNRIGVRFDVAFGTSGGEDTLFTRTLTARGGELRWCAEAGVTDVVPATRVTRDWVVRRAFSSGNSWALTSPLIATRTASALSARLTDGARGGVRLAGGLALFTAGLLTASVPRRSRGVRTGARGAGMLLGAFGYRYQEYRRAE